MSVNVTPFLRNTLLADAAMGAAAALPCILGSGMLAGLTGLPAGLVFWAGVALVPVACVLFGMSRRERLSRMSLVDIVALNTLWAAASFGLLASGWIAPNGLGVAFVVLQALAVAIFALLEGLALRQVQPQSI